MTEHEHIKIVFMEDKQDQSLGDVPFTNHSDIFPPTPPPVVLDTATWNT